MLIITKEHIIRRTLYHSYSLAYPRHSLGFLWSLFAIRGGTQFPNLLACLRAALKTSDAGLHFGGGATSSASSSSPLNSRSCSLVSSRMKFGCRGILGGNILRGGQEEGRAGLPILRIGVPCLSRGTLCTICLRFGRLVRTSASSMKYGQILKSRGKRTKARSGASSVCFDLDVCGSGSEKSVIVSWHRPLYVTWIRGDGIPYLMIGAAGLTSSRDSSVGVE